MYSHDSLDVKNVFADGNVLDFPRVSVLPGIAVTRA
jgi:hypothetical protein